MLNQFLRKEDDVIIHTGELLEFYIPSSFFETNIAKYEGSEINTLGLFYVREFKGDKALFTELLNLPSWISLFPDSTREEHITITGHEKDDKYTIASFYKNSPVMTSYMNQNSDNIENYLNLILAGKINHVPYDMMMKLWEKNLSINSLGLGVPASSQEIILSEMYAASDNPDITFCVAKNKNPKLNTLDYRSRNIRDICSRSSTFAALSFEDFDTMLASSLNMTKEEKEQNISPLEKVIKY